ncbi:hypothetical protein N789_14765 [Arenimonas oryziterrae DSM 21050 = YC6267]|uniref:Uncharacterized protein n=1 Tax=Arenimonas oryziterrae DSM 21050 = YC6267 TaxID=1121015 RepID=A0A091BBF5_9GAMM|nr:hypothetical protein N789_14765 [Arenimonas oryziterrae DSM 21050 = YC6267]
MDTSQIDELIARCSSDIPTTEIFSSIFDTLHHEEFCDAFSRRVAHEYLAGRLTYASADQAMNCLDTFCHHSTERGMPEYSWDVYLAFDEGEYLHPGDPDEVDPVAKYTRPAVQEIVARDNAE